jgi:anti-sigma factor RsiW
MYDFDTERLIEALLDGRISKTEAVRLEAMMEDNPTIRHRIERDKRLQSVLETSKAQAFNAGFERRIVSAIAQEQALHTLLSAHRSKAFPPFFDARVMASLRKDLGQKSAFFDAEFSEILGRYFTRVALPTIAAAGIAMATNFGAASPDSPLVDRLMGLPSQDADGPSYLVVS